MADQLYGLSAGYSSRKKAPVGKIIFVLILLSAFGSAGLWGFRNRDRLLLKYFPDKHLRLKQQHADMLREIDTAAKTRESAAKDHLNLFEKLRVDFPGDPEVFRLEALLCLHYLKLQAKENSSLVSRRLFSQILGRYRFVPEMELHLWQRAVLSFRKALTLEKDTKKKADIGGSLIWLYFWGDAAYLDAMAAFRPVAGSESAAYVEMLKILAGKQEPAWEQLEKMNPEEDILFWRGLYFLQSGNEPRAFSYLRQVSELKPEDKDADKDRKKELVDDALYLLGGLMAREKRLKSQLKYYEQIDAENFLKRNPWFLREMNFLLRFLGKTNEATAFLHRHEKAVLDRLKNAGETESPKADREEDAEDGKAEEKSSDGSDSGKTAIPDP